MNRTIITWAVVVALAACGRDTSDDSQLHQMFDEGWAFWTNANPLLATAAGDNTRNDRLPSVTREGVEARGAFAQETLERLSVIDRSALGAQDRISYDVFERRLRDDIAELKYQAYLIPITVDNGFHIGFARLPNQVPLSTSDDYQNYLARLRAFPEYVSQHVALMRDGLSVGMTLPQVVLQGYETTISAHVVTDPEQSVFYAPFVAFPSTVSAEKHESLRQSAQAVIMEAVVPGYQRFLEFMTQEYIPGARTTIAAYDLPRGSEYYQYLIEHFTTLSRTPEDIHQVGLQEVERIRTEMLEIVTELGWGSDLAGFIEFLRTDPQFYPETPAELLREATYLAKKMDGKLPSLFHVLPRQPYGVQPVPDHLAPKYTGGRYIGAPLDGTEPGYYWVNTYELSSRPLYVMPSLTLHEAVPGHHLQNALAKELEGVPVFRRFSGLSAFGEGWGLYSEWLGIEAGMYPDPYTNFGRLTYEMWRACRLVVDTGIHAMGWSRQEAMDFMAANTALSLHEIRTETDRYIAWPGQALAYKMGELTIKNLRQRSEDALGDRFDVRDFHHAVLQNGPVPLPILEEEIERYIARHR